MDNNNNPQILRSLTNKSFQKRSTNTQSSFETKVMSMIENLQKGFDNLSQEIFSIKAKIFKYKSCIDRLESFVFYNDNSNNLQEFNDDQNYDMTKEDDDHNSNATETPNNETSKQYFQHLILTKPDLDENQNQMNQSTSTQD